MIDFDPATEPVTARPECEPARVALQRFLDRDPDWDTSTAASHRVTCLDCRGELALARSIAGAFRPAVVPVNLPGRVMRAATKDRRRRRLWRSAGVGGALAESVVVAVMLFQTTPQTVTEHPSVAALPKPTNDSAPAKPLGEAVSDARDALVSLTRRTASETQQTSAGLIPSPKLPDMPTGGDGLEPLADAQAAAARSVDPIKASARRALNLFLRAADPPTKPALQ